MHNGRKKSWAHAAKREKKEELSFSAEGKKEGHSIRRLELSKGISLPLNSFPLPLHPQSEKKIEMAPPDSGAVQSLTWTDERRRERERNIIRTPRGDIGHQRKW